MQRGSSSRGAGATAVGGVGNDGAAGAGDVDEDISLKVPALTIWFEKKAVQHGVNGGVNGKD